MIFLLSPEGEGKKGQKTNQTLKYFFGMLHGGGWLGIVPLPKYHSENWIYKTDYAEMLNLHIYFTDCGIVKQSVLSPLWHKTYTLL